MRNPYTRPGGMFGRRAAGGFTRASAAAAPTVILNAVYLTDTLLNASANPVSNGDPVDSWAMATGGTFTNALAVTAGASAYPVYVAASGVHTAAGNAALTCATPVTIPADTDFRLYVSFKMTSGLLFALGRTSGIGRLQISPAGGVSLNAPSGTNAARSAAIPTGSNVLLRILRVGTTYTSAWTGTASATMTDGDITLAEEFTFNTLLAYSDGESSLDTFSDTGNYLRTLKISYGVGTADTDYETTINGSPL
jgi:hypothetical protein